MQRISSGLVWSSAISLATRCARTVVFPVPAPATTSMGPCTWSMATFWRWLGTKLTSRIMLHAAQRNNGENRGKCGKAGLTGEEKIGDRHRRDGGSLGAK